MSMLNIQLFPERRVLDLMLGLVVWWCPLVCRLLQLPTPSSLSPSCLRWCSVTWVTACWWPVLPSTWSSERVVSSPRRVTTRYSNAFFSTCQNSHLNPPGSSVCVQWKCVPSAFSQLTLQWTVETCIDPLMLVEKEFKTQTTYTVLTSELCWSC